MSGLSGAKNEPRFGEGAATGGAGGPPPAPAANNPGREASSPSPRTSRRGGLVIRGLLILAALALLFSPLFPYWNLKLAAPQYPKGLSLAIYPHHVGGDVSEIDGLNHYIGMRKIDDAAQMERRLGVPALVVMTACLVIASLWSSRWAVLLVVPVIYSVLDDLGTWIQKSWKGKKER